MKKERKKKNVVARFFLQSNFHFKNQETRLKQQSVWVSGMFLVGVEAVVQWWDYTVYPPAHQWQCWTDKHRLEGDN